MLFPRRLLHLVMSNLKFNACRKHFYKMLAEIWTFKLKNSLTWSINLYYAILP